MVTLGAHSKYQTCVIISVPFVSRTLCGTRHNIKTCIWLHVRELGVIKCDMSNTHMHMRVSKCPILP